MYIKNVTQENVLLCVRFSHTYVLYLHNYIYLIYMYCHSVSEYSALGLTRLCLNKRFIVIKPYKTTHLVLVSVVMYC